MPRKSVQKERRAQILAALNTCLQEKSFQQTSIKDIARVAGVNHGVLHYYFKSKEDILLCYIDYVMEHYRSLVEEWLGARDTTGYSRRDYIQAIFEFVNHKITLNQELSRLFVEIWEIALYNEAVRKKLQQSYTLWIETLRAIIQKTAVEGMEVTNLSVAMVAFWEGMALFSTVFDRTDLGVEEVLAGFQQQILNLV